MPFLPSDPESTEGTLDWPHAPPHRLAEAGVYFVTARLTDGIPHLGTPVRRGHFQELLHRLAEKHSWRLEAWAILSNHYHLVGHSPADGTEARSLVPFLRSLHSLSARRWNEEDAQPGRGGLWQNYRETHLTFQRSYLSRLNYVHQNARHHRLVERGSDYPWCSAAAFKKAVTPAWCRTIGRFSFDEIAAADGE